MKIPFISLKSPYEFNINSGDVNFKGQLLKLKNGLVECQGQIFGNLESICDRCGKEIILELNYQVKLNLSDGIYEDQENELSDTIEFLDGKIDLAYVLESEIESFKSDYFYCENCKEQ